IPEPPAPEPEPEPTPIELVEDLPEAPLLRLDPVSVTPTATPAEIARALDLRLQLFGARAAVAIALAWDSGRLATPDPMRPPFIDEVAGLLGLASGQAPAELSFATSLQRAIEDLAMDADGRRADRLTPLDVLVRDFHLSQIAVAILFSIVA